MKDENSCEDKGLLHGTIGSENEEVVPSYYINCA